MMDNIMSTGKELNLIRIVLQSEEEEEKDFECSQQWHHNRKFLIQRLLILIFESVALKFNINVAAAAGVSVFVLI